MSGLFSYFWDVLEHLFVETQTGNHFPQAAVLNVELPSPAWFRDT
jgi:hypothetical protein